MNYGRHNTPDGLINRDEPSIEDLLKTIEKVIKTESPRSESHKDTPSATKHSMKRPDRKPPQWTPAVRRDINSPYSLGAPLNPQEIRIPPLILKNPLPQSGADHEDPYLLSREAFVSVTQTFSELSRTITQKTYATTSASAPSGTLDARVMTLLKGLVKEWIDQHMPALVEELVKKELDHVRKSIP